MTFMIHRILDYDELYAYLNSMEYYDRNYECYIDDAYVTCIVTTVNIYILDLDMSINNNIDLFKHKVIIKDLRPLFTIEYLDMFYAQDYYAERFNRYTIKE